jgi:hypothetical protein
MLQEDIDRLLKVRPIIDSFKETKEYIDMYKEVESDITGLRISVTEDIEKAVQELLKQLNELGFKSIEEVSKFNDDMEKSLIFEYRSLMGQCDFCDGYKGDPPCRKLFSNKSCFVTKKCNTRESDWCVSLFGDMRAYAIRRKEVKKGDLPSNDDLLTDWTKNPLVTIDKDTVRFLCPPNHGFYHDYRVKDEDLPFDPYWYV